MKRISNKQRELNIIDEALESMGALEDQWTDRLLDYKEQHYPLLLFAVSAAKAKTKEYIEEHKRMESDSVFQGMLVQMDKELNEADDKITQLINRTKH